MKLINMKEYAQFGRVFGPLIYMYIGGIFLMTFVGCLIQFQIKQTNKNEEQIETQSNEKNPQIKEENIVQ